MWIPGCVRMGHVLLYNSSTLALTNRAFAWDHIPASYIFLKICKTFTWLDFHLYDGSEFQAFGSRYLMILTPKVTWPIIGFSRFVLISNYPISIPENSFIKAGFILFSVLKISIERRLSLVTFIVLFPASFRIGWYEES